VIEVIVIDGKSEDFAELLKKLSECDCPKCRAYREAQTAKPEPEVKPEEPKPNWTPAVGMLIQSEQEGIWEITGILTGGASLERVSDRLRGNFPNHVLAKYRPIAELEGLEVGDNVYSISKNGDIHTFRIHEQGQSSCWVKAGDVLTNSDETGVPIHFGNGKQMFWRTKERAERFGK